MADYTKEQLMGALKKADAAGDTKAAQAIARKLNSLRTVEEQPQQVPQPEQAEPEKDIDISQSDAIVRGFGQGLTLETLDEGIASYKTGKEVLGEMANHLMEQGAKGIIDQTPTLAETYRKHKDDQQVYLAKLREKYPMSYQGSNIAGLLTNTGATMGLAAYMHGARAVAHLPNAMGLMGGAGFIHGIGSSESDTMGEVLDEGIEGFKAGAVGEALVPGLKAVKGARVDSFLKFLNVRPHKIKNSLAQYNKQIVPWAERSLNYTSADGSKIVSPFKRRATMLEDVDFEKEIAGSEMGAILNDIDTNFKLDIDPKLIYSDIKRYALEPLQERTLNAKHLKTIEKADKFLRETLFESPTINGKTQMPEGNLFTPNPKLNLTRLHELRKGMYRDLKTTTRSGDPSLVNTSLVEQFIADRLGHNIKEVIETSSKLKGQDLLGQYANASQKYGDLSELSKVLHSTLTQDKGASILANVVNDKMFGAAAMLTAAGNPGAGIRKAGIVTMGIRAIASHPGVNGVIAKGANTIANAAEKNPAKYEVIMRGLAGAASISGEAFMEEFMTASAKVDLMETPLARTTAEVIRRKDSILTMLNSKNPELATSLADAIDNQKVDVIREIMSVHGKGKMIQAGIGWDGVAVTDQDKAQVQQWLQSVSDNRKRMYLTNQFGKDSMIPQEMIMGTPQKEIMRQFIHNKKRNKVSKPEL